MFEVCICKLKYPKNEVTYYSYDTIYSAINDILKWLKNGTIKEENICYIEYIKER